MKKITLKITAFFLLAMFALQVDAQPILWTENGTYKIGARGTNLFMTINLTATPPAPFVEWQEELPGDDEKQVFTIIDHRTPASAGLMEITANVTGVGNVTLCTADDSGHPNLTLTVRPGDPLSVTPLAGDYSGLDQFQRRKAKVDANGDPDSGGANPSDGNNALFLRNTLGTNSRYGIIPSAAGDPVQFDGGGIDVLDFHLVESLLSTEEFDTSSVFISNPVKDELTIESVEQNIKQVSVYNLLGQRVISSNVEDSSLIKLDVSSLNSGIYILKLEGENNAIFSKKIIKE